ncbi:hypothetical protein UPYG_G00024060 [Umbra pygmaea]|uniref:Uncharacterized protein n=1 Tax=Umbra pygmaea TaxID=75934 RepID=A0ABD0YAG8_UMBPY
MDYFSLPGRWMYYCYFIQGRNFPCSLFFTGRFLSLLVFLHASVLHPDPCLSHPQPCHILARIGHTVRLGVLLPIRQPARVQNALNRALTGLKHQTGDGIPPLLPYNLTLEVVSRSPLGGDPSSMSSCVCQEMVARGVSGVLAFPRSPEELIHIHFLSSFLKIPFISLLEDLEPLRNKDKTSQSLRGKSEERERMRERAREREGRKE